MVQKGIIRAIDLEARRAYVNIPIFQNAASTSEVLFCCPFSYQPGNVASYSVGDVVYVGFENNDLEFPFILGKLYTKKDTGESPTAFNGNSLTITGKTVLSDDTKIGEITYDKLLELIAKTDSLTDNVDKATSAITNLSNSSLSNNSGSSSSSAMDLGKIAYEKVMVLEPKVADLEERVTVIEEALTELLYKDFEYISEPNWKLDTNKGYQIFYKVKNVDTNESHEEYAKTVVNWSQYDYCNWNQTDFPKESMTSVSNVVTPNSELDVNIQPGQLDAQPGWLKQNWIDIFTKTGVSKNGAFPNMAYTNSTNGIDNSFIEVVTNSAGTAKAYGTKKKILNLDMLNRKQSKITLVPENTGLSFYADKASTTPTVYQYNMWYSEPAIVTSWGYDWSGSAENLGDTSAGWSGNKIEAQSKFNFIIGNIKQLQNLSSANIRLLLKFNLSGYAKYYPRLDSSAAEIYTEQSITFNEKDYLYISAAELLHNVSGNSSDFTVDVTGVVSDRIKRLVGEDKDIKLLLAITAKSIGEGKKVTGTINQSNDPWEADVSIKDIILEYFYVADAINSHALSNIPVSLPVCYCLRQNGQSHEGQELLGKWSNYEHVVGLSGIIDPISIGGQLRDPIVNYANIVKIVADDGKILKTMLRVQLKNTNYISGLSQDANTGITLEDISEDGKWNIYLGLFKTSNGDRAVLFGDGGYVKVSVPTNQGIVSNAYYKSTDSEGHFVTNPDAWTIHDTYINLDIDLTDTNNVSQEASIVDYSQVVVGMKAIKFVKNSYTSSNDVLINNLDWTKVETAEDFPGKLKKISSTGESWQCYSGALEEIKIVGQSHTINYQIPTELSSYATAPSSYTGYFVPSPLPTATITSLGEEYGYKFLSWKNGDVDLVAGSVLNSDLTVTATFTRKTERVKFEGINSGQLDKIDGGTISNAEQFNISFDIPYKESLKNILSSQSEREKAILDGSLSKAKTAFKNEVVSNNFVDKGSETYPFNDTAYIFNDKHYLYLSNESIVAKTDPSYDKDWRPAYWRYYYTKKNADNSEVLITDFANEVPTGVGLPESQRTYKLNKVKRENAKFYDSFGYQPSTGKPIYGTKLGELEAEIYTPILNNSLNIKDTPYEIGSRCSTNPRVIYTGWSCVAPWGGYFNSNTINVGNETGDLENYFKFYPSTKQVDNLINLHFGDSSTDMYYPVNTVLRYSNLPSGHEIFNHCKLNQININHGEYVTSPEALSYNTTTNDVDVIYQYKAVPTPVEYYTADSSSMEYLNTDNAIVNWGNPLEYPRDGTKISNVDTKEDLPYWEFKGWTVDGTPISGSYQVPDWSSKVQVTASYQKHPTAQFIAYLNPDGTTFKFYPQVSLEKTLSEAGAWPDSHPSKDNYDFVGWFLANDVQIDANTQLPERYHYTQVYVNPHYKPVPKTLRFFWNNEQAGKSDTGSYVAHQLDGNAIGADIYNEAVSQATIFGKKSTFKDADRHMCYLKFNAYSTSDTQKYEIDKNTIVHGDSSYYAWFVKDYSPC